MNEQNKTYSTSDLSLAAAASLNFPIKSVDKTNPRRAEFVFVDTPELREFIQQFWQHELTVEPNLFFQQIKFIKSRIYAEQ